MEVEPVKFEDLKGRTILKIVGKIGGESIRFCMENGDEYLLYHDRDCCEHVEVDDIVGDVHNIIASPILVAEEVSNSGDPKPDGDFSHTWTFYKIETWKGGITIKFYGESNGYYSEKVDFKLVKRKGKLLDEYYHLEELIIHLRDGDRKAAHETWPEGMYIYMLPRLNRILLKDPRSSSDFFDPEKFQGGARGREWLLLEEYTRAGLSMREIEEMMFVCRQVLSELRGKRGLKYLFARVQDMQERLKTELWALMGYVKKDEDKE